MSTPRVLLALTLYMTTFLSAACGSQEERKLQLETTEVTAPEITVDPDGDFIVFSMLGHLFRLPVGGGEAIQLTRGPSYDTDPSFSPDGRHLAFVSDRDGSDGNLFLLEVATGEVSRITSEFRVASPVWSLDGKTIAYLYYPRREEYPLEAIPGIGFGPSETAGIRTVPVGGGAPTDIRDPGSLGSLFYLGDGRVAWTKDEGSRNRSGSSGIRVEAFTPQGVVTLCSIQAPAADVAVGPKGDGVYYASGGNLYFHSFQDGTPQRICSLPEGLARPVAARDGRALFAGGSGKLWRIALPSGKAEQIEWRARVILDVRRRQLPKWTPPTTEETLPLEVLTPRISPDGQKLVFMAAGTLWEQPFSGGQAKQLVDEQTFQCDPAFSPDGRRLAFTSDNRGTREVRIFDFTTRESRTLLSAGGASWPLLSSWSSDGERLVVQKTDGFMGPSQLIRVSVADGVTQQIGVSGRSWNGRPHFSRDGRFLYFTGRLEKYAQLYRLALARGSKPEAVTRLERHVHDALVSPDENWVAFRRNTEIWIAPMGTLPLSSEDFRCINDEGGRSFSFTADSSALVYSTGPRVWRQTLTGGEPVEIPVHLRLPHGVPPPLLIRHVRALDFKNGRFSEETSMLIEQGRIQWIGAESERRVPSDASILDAGGRYAIPGLHDSHVHSVWANHQASEDAFIAYGVTSVRDVGGRLDIVKALQDRSESTGLPVPRYFYSGEIFEGLMPMWGDAFLEIATPTEAREYVRRWKAAGAHFIKVYPSLPWSLKRMVADEAHRMGLPLVGHGLSLEEIVKSVTLGFITLEHVGRTIYGDVIKLLAASGTQWDPTLTVGEKSAINLEEDPGRFEDAKIRRFVPAEELAITLRGVGMFAGRSPEALHAGWNSKLSRVMAAYQSGVKILDGTDSLMTGIFFGPSLHWELEYLAEAGLPPLEVLRLATQGAAEVVGASADLGSLDAGQLADMVLLDADPLDSIENTQEIWRVIKDGHLFDPDKLRPHAAASK